MPRPASCSCLIALTAASLFPLSRKCFTTRRALMWRTFQGGGGNIYMLQVSGPAFLVQSSCLKQLCTHIADTGWHKWCYSHCTCRCPTLLNAVNGLLKISPTHQISSVLQTDINEAISMQLYVFFRNLGWYC